jgi:hypothetical protein
MPDNRARFVSLDMKCIQGSLDLMRANRVGILVTKGFNPSLCSAGIITFAAPTGIDM